MALPLAGIAANLLLGAAIGAGISLFGGRGNDKPAASSTRPSTPRNTGVPAWINNNFVKTDTATAVNVVNDPAQNIQVTQAVRPASPQATAKPETVAEKAQDTAAEIQRLPVFTPTAPTLSTKNYSSERRTDVQKTKAGEQQLRNPLAIDKDAASAAISSNLPSIGVSASGTSIANTGPGPIKKGNSNAR